MPIILIYLEKSLRWILFHTIYFYSMRSGHFDKCCSAGWRGAWERVSERQRKRGSERDRDTEIKTAIETKTE